MLCLRYIFRRRAKTLFHFLHSYSVGTYTEEGGEHIYQSLSYLNGICTIAYDYHALYLRFIGARIRGRIIDQHRALPHTIDLSACARYSVLYAYLGHDIALLISNTKKDESQIFQRATYFSSTKFTDLTAR